MLQNKIEDRYGNELTVGSQVLYCEFERSSNVEEGVITSILGRFITIDTRYDRMNINGVKEKLVLNPYKK